MRVTSAICKIFGAVLFVALTVAPASGAKTNRYGGPIYNGQPALAVTSSLVAAGGGAANFSVAKALNAMIGPKLTQAEVAKLDKQYGKNNVDLWVKSFNFAVDDALKIATADGIQLPAPTLSGKKLASTLVNAGTDPGTDTWWSGLALDKALSHKIHDRVMDDVDQSPAYGAVADYKLHQITNQAFYDLAQALGDKQVRLASIH